MKETNDILTKVNRNGGMTVPEGFFADFAAKMADTLPERPEVEHPQLVKIPQVSLWHRVRPFVYMAAMFGGIWCMMKMFTMMTPQNSEFSIDNNHILTEALSDDNFVFDYLNDDINDREIFDEMYDDSISVDDVMQVSDY
jgi:hypothetical protein